ncbi:hypothetical protein BX661DRAFT_188654 [Kickxella alabastrina]|uniref:uncharacterized protein n=1 Tax=Kickxella alabastrina TaxID=61397 RepID=UPI00221F4934|nr:uncharacterized protein BX661DRAFT_188654 [Kickxella alabastrina]KAI7821131.1 hypothetical protein BX661DRAFT_188654 [Kickxella alabastrina]KAJ1945817.1 hypothetical protein GGF37_001509 [Kickxella alabastrina]
MLRGFVDTVVIILTALLALISLSELGMFAGVQLIMIKRHLVYTRSWLYFFRWVVLALSICFSVRLMVYSWYLCRCGGRKRSMESSSNRTFPYLFGLLSLILAPLWAVIVSFQVRGTDSTMVATAFNNFTSGQTIVFPLGKGFLLKDDCHASPFTQIEYGEITCSLLKASTIITIILLGLWTLSLIFAISLGFLVHRTRYENNTDIYIYPRETAAPEPKD